MKLQLGKKAMEAIDKLVGPDGHAIVQVAIYDWISGDKAKHKKKCTYRDKKDRLQVGKVGDMEGLEVSFVIDQHRINDETVHVEWVAKL